MLSSAKNCMITPKIYSLCSSGEKIASVAIGFLSSCIRCGDWLRLKKGEGFFQSVDEGQKLPALQSLARQVEHDPRVGAVAARLDIVILQGPDKDQVARIQADLCVFQNKFSDAFFKIINLIIIMAVAEKIGGFGMLLNGDTEIGIVIFGQKPMIFFIHKKSITCGKRKSKKKV